MKSHFEDYARNLNRIRLHMFLDKHALTLRISQARASLVANPLVAAPGTLTRISAACGAASSVSN